MKNVLFLGLMMTLFVLSSCTTEDDCTAPAVESNIVGTWSFIGTSNTFEFFANGTLEDPSDEVFSFEFNGVKYTEKTYSINSTSDTLTVVATEPNTSNSADAKFPIVKNECNTITLSVASISAPMQRQ
jgi:hypothetical protein